MRSRVASAVIALSAIVVPGCSTPPARHEFREMHMGCEARLVIVDHDADRARAAARRAFDRIAALDRVLSDWTPISEVTRLADRTVGSPGPVAISEDLDRVLRCSLDLWRATEGRFDPALGARTQLWRRTLRSGEEPTAEALAQASRESGADAILLSAGAISFTRPGVRLDFGAIGKGFAADEALAVLVEADVPAALVEIGGDLVVGAAPADGRDWSIALEALGRTVTLPPWSAAATSGDRVLALAGHGPRRSHILDPDGGLGVIDAPEVTVLVGSRPRGGAHGGPGVGTDGSCGAGAVADALATALSVAPPADRARLLARFPEARAVFATRDGVQILPMPATRDSFGPGSPQDPAASR